MQSLSTINKELNETVIGLEIEVNALTTKVETLENLNSDLLTILSFFNETTGDIGSSVQEIAEYLAVTIEENRVILEETLKNTYLQTFTFWDCAYADAFRDQPFIIDFDVSIGPEFYYKVMDDFVEERVLSEFCLVTSDVEQFLEDYYVVEGVLPPFNVTSNELIAGVNVYVNTAFNYYFPTNGRPGLDSVDWEKAGYECQKLPSEKRFKFTGLSF